MTPSESVQRLMANMEKVFIGKDETVKMAVISLLANGHLLIEDVPGVGKTLLARALAKSINCAFRRIQFTPDLLPSDILGVSIFDSKENRFEFKPGPIFANVVLADEINRTTPRTQSSLLEAMNDFQVSVDGVTRKLHLPFIVMATQNPFEFEGTYPLLESQLDRFLMKVSIGYPGVRDEKQILASQRTANPIDELQPALTVDEVLELQ
ncbi:MAG: AAA family ATPase, partial [Planctomycetes bacterium]|nr:AAA family ATPase [Planctomycetota bacterium]